MSNIKALNYPGILRAFNKIEECPDIDNKIETLATLSKLMDKTIQEDLKCIRSRNNDVFKRIEVSEKEAKKLLLQLEENNIVLYEGMTNADALIVRSKRLFVRETKANPKQKKYKHVISK